MIIRFWHVLVGNSLPETLQNLAGNKPMRTLKYICWEPPPSNWLKLNSDGSVKFHNEAACGGVIRDDSGHAIRSFIAKLGSCPVTVAELWGAYRALNIA